MVHTWLAVADQRSLKLSKTLETDCVHPDVQNRIHDTIASTCELSVPGMALGSQLIRCSAPDPTGGASHNCSGAFSLSEMITEADTVCSWSV